MTGQWDKVKEEWEIARDIINKAVMEGTTTNVDIRFNNQHSICVPSRRVVTIRVDFIDKE